MTAELIALAFRRVAGLELRSASLECDEPRDRTFLCAKADELDAAAKQVQLFIGDPSGFEAFLSVAVFNLERERPDGISLRAVDHIENAARALRALSVVLNVEGSGSAWLSGNREAKGHPDCVVGLLQLVSTIDAYVLDLYAQATGLDRDRLRNVRLSTEVVPSRGWHSTASLVDGRTELRQEGARVRILFKEGEAWSADTPWHIAYTNYHELVCHAHQGVRIGSAVLTNASPECNWSEGWLDAVAMCLVTEALRGMPDLGLKRGGVAEDAVTAMHASRYRQPPDGDVVLYNRMGARNAFRAFSDCVVLSGHSTPEAAAIQFSLLLNASLEAEGDLLTALTLRLFRIFQSPKATAAFEAAKCCMAFVEHQDAERLLAEIKAVGSGA